jgi:hypothetical protein
MPRYQDLTGRTFGRLVVVSLGVATRKASTGARIIRWNCKCECGNEALQVAAASLTNGRSRSCGCLRLESCRSKKIRKHTKSVFDYVKMHYECGAYSRKLSFTLSDDNFMSLITGPCYFCGAPPLKANPHGRDRETFRYNGVDRLDNSRGYEWDNCVSCCTTCNRMKLAAGASEFAAQCFKVVVHQYLKLAAGRVALIPDILSPPASATTVRFGEEEDRIFRAVTGKSDYSSSDITESLCGGRVQ